MPIESLTASHADGLIALSEALHADPSPCSFWGITHDRVADWLGEDRRHTLVRVESGRIDAVGAVTRGGTHQSHLGELSVAVHPGRRRGGIARRMVAELEATAEREGIEILKALIWVGNRPSRRLFSSLGYEHRATLMAEFKGGPIGEIDDAVYYKRLRRVNVP